MSEGEVSSAGADGGLDHDDWKDFSNVTKWECFIHDVCSGTATATRAQARSKKERTVYNGCSYALRRLNGKASAAAAATAGSQDDGSEFPPLAEVLGEEECPLDAWFAPDSATSTPSSTSASAKLADEEATERELMEDTEAWRLLRSWFGFGDFLCLHEAASPASSRSGGGGLGLEQLLSTGVIAMDGRRCGAVLALRQAGGDGDRRRDHRDWARKGVSVKGYAILSPAGDADWTRRAETVWLESKTSSVVPRFRRSLEAFGELLQEKALSAWGGRGDGGHLEACARYTWERRLYDGRAFGDDEGGGDDLWQTAWRTHFWRERSHRRRRPRDCAVRSLLSKAEGEYGGPVWGPEEDPLERVRLSAEWRGFGVDRPLPHAPLELLGVFSNPEGGGSLSRWNVSAKWETSSGAAGSLGLKLRLLVAVYVHCLALGGDLLMADVCNPDPEAADELSAARDKARHIGAGAVLGPGTRELIARMATTSHHGAGGVRGDEEDRADPADIIHSVRYLLTPRRSPPSLARGTDEQTGVAAAAAEARGGHKAGTGGGSGGGGGKEDDEDHRSPWLWVPRGGAPACRLVSQLALEAARFGAEGVCLGDVAAFWKSFIHELRFLWEEGAPVPQMEPEPAADGLSMYDPSATGQDSGRSAQLRRNIHPARTSPSPSSPSPGMGSVGVNAGFYATATQEGASGGGGGVALTLGEGEPREQPGYTRRSREREDDGSREREDDGSAAGEALGGDQSRSTTSRGGGGRGATLPPPPPDMRTCLLNQKLQMLNCCVAEQNRVRALGTSSTQRSKPSPEVPGGRQKEIADFDGRDEGGGGHSSLLADKKSGSEDLENVGLGVAPRGAARDETYPGEGAAIAAATAGHEAVTRTAASKNGASGALAGGGDHGGGGNDARFRLAGVRRRGMDGHPSKDDVGDVEGSAKMKQAAFAAERDAILRRVGVKKESAGGGGSNNGRDGGFRGWWEFVGVGGGGSAGRGGDAGGKQDLENQEAPAPSSLGRRGGSNGSPSTTGSHDCAGDRTRLASSVGSGSPEMQDRQDMTKGLAGTDALEDAPPSDCSSSSRNSGGPPPPSRGKVRGAVSRVGGAVKKVGGATVRKVGGVVRKVRDHRANSATPEESEEEGVAEGETLVKQNGGRAGERIPTGEEACGEGASQGRTREGGGGGGGAAVAAAVSPSRAGVTFTCFTGHRLLVTGERAVVPELLPECPLTSDMLEQQQELVRRLSVTAESSHSSDATLSKTGVSRLRLATLAADMRCFLVQNPGAVFADFLRWYSPSNWSGGVERRPGLGDDAGVEGGVGGGGGGDVGAGDGEVVTMDAELSGSTAELGATVRGIVAEVVEEAIERAAMVGAVAAAAAAAAAGQGASPVATVPEASPILASSPPSSARVVVSRNEQDSADLAARAEAAVTGGDKGGRLDWGERGKVIWRPPAAGKGTGGTQPVPLAATVAATTTADEVQNNGVDEQEGMEWLETWLRVEAAGSNAATGVGNGLRDDSAGVCHQNALFNPSKEAEKALHYIETIGPAQLVSQLLIALACTAGFLLSEAQTDALELPCVKVALARVRSTVLSATEGLFEASAGGGVLLMGNQVAHPISQSTLAQCDTLCDVVDEAESLLSRGTSLLHKLPGEYDLVEALVTSNVATGTSYSYGVGPNGNKADSGNGGDGPLGALAHYLASGDPAPAPFPTAQTPTPSPGVRGGSDDAFGADGTPWAQGRAATAGGGDVGASDGTSDLLGDYAAAGSGGIAATDDVTGRYPTAMAAVAGDRRAAPPPPRVQEYLIRWRLPRVLRRGAEAADVGDKVEEEEEEEEEGVGARLYARVMNGSWRAGGGAEEDHDEADAPADVRLALSIAEPPINRELRF